MRGCVHNLRVQTPTFSVTARPSSTANTATVRVAAFIIRYDIVQSVKTYTPLGMRQTQSHASHAIYRASADISRVRQNICRL